MSSNSDDREKIKQELIQRIGHWAFQSYPKSSWHSLPDKEIIEGSLLRAKPDDKLMLLQIYNLDQIRAIWEKYVVIQDDWFHDANLWAAKNFFNAKNPEEFVRQHCLKSRRVRLTQAINFS